MKKAAPRSTSSSKASAKHQFQNVKSRYKETKIPKGARYDPTMSAGTLSAITNFCLKKVLQFAINDYGTIIALRKICRRFFYLLKDDVEIFVYINKPRVSDYFQLMNYLRV